MEGLIWSPRCFAMYVWWFCFQREHFHDLLLRWEMNSRLLKPFVEALFSPSLWSHLNPFTQAPTLHYATACMESDLHIVFLHPCS